MTNRLANGSWPGNRFDRATTITTGLGPVCTSGKRARAADLRLRGRRCPDRGSSIAKPYVVGAIIELGQCLDLTTPEGLSLVLEAHRSLLGLYGAAGYRLPVNDDNLLRRRLDCAVIRRVHEIQQTAGRPAIDTVKGLFVEGPPLYPGAGFATKTHVQIAVCNMSCIKGVFRVRPDDLR